VANTALSDPWNPLSPNDPRLGQWGVIRCSVPVAPDEFRETVASVHGPAFDFLRRTLLRREGAYIRRLLPVPERRP